MRMNLKRVAMLACLSAGFSGAVNAEETKQDMFYRQRIAEAAVIAAGGQHARADRLMDQLLAEPAYQSLPANERSDLLSRAALVAWQNERLDVARQRYAELARQGSDNPDDWYRLAAIALEQDDKDAAAEAMTEFAARWPEYLDNIESELLLLLAAQGDTSSPARLGFQQALFDANWKGGASNTPGAIWFRLARARLEQGDIEAARQVVRRIQEPDSVISMRADRRFDALLDPKSPRADVMLATERQIQLLRTRAEVYPDKLEPLLQLSYMLLFAGNNQEVIDLSDAAIARITAAEVGKPAFTDLEKQLWLMNNKAIALRRLGRIDEAHAEMKRASQLSENGTDNVSQVLNLGDMECLRGNARQALAAADSAPTANLSGYGKAVAASIRHCAAMLDNNARARRQALAQLRALRDEAPMPYFNALIQDDPSAALAYMQELLDSPMQRNEVLDWAQECRTPDALPGQIASRQREAAFRERADVKAAIEKVGRIERYEVYCQLGQ